MSAKMYIEAVRSKRHKQQLRTFLTRKVLQRTEEAIVRGRIRGNKRNKGKRRGGGQNLNLLCQITDFLLRLFRNGEPHGGGLCFFCWEETGCFY